MKKLFTLFVLFGFVSILSAQKDSSHFVFTIQTDSIGNSNDSSFLLNINTNYTYNYDVDWTNDGIFDDLGLTDSIYHQYAQPGQYTIRIKGVYPAIKFGRDNLLNSHDGKKLLSVDQWGTYPWKNLENAFAECSNFTIIASDPPNLDSVKSLARIFRSATILNSDRSNWDVSNITNFHAAFQHAKSFNQNINDWDVSSAITMEQMFEYASAFNQPLDKWEVSKVGNMLNMFHGAIDFNQDVESWDISNVTHIRGIFNGAISFNQKLNNWDVSICNIF